MTAAGFGNAARERTRWTCAKTRVVIVGAGQAGGRAAEALRAAGHVGPITLIGEEAHLPYERPQLSKSILLDSEPNPAFIRSSERLGRTRRHPVDVFPRRRRRYRPARDRTGKTEGRLHSTSCCWRQARTLAEWPKSRVRRATRQLSPLHGRCAGAATRAAAGQEGRSRWRRRHRPRGGLRGGCTRLRCRGSRKGRYRTPPGWLASTEPVCARTSRRQGREDHVRRFRQAGNRRRQSSWTTERSSPPTWSLSALASRRRSILRTSLD